MHTACMCATHTSTACKCLCCLFRFLVAKCNTATSSLHSQPNILLEILWLPFWKWHLIWAHGRATIKPAGWNLSTYLSPRCRRDVVAGECVARNSTYGSAFCPSIMLFFTPPTLSPAHCPWRLYTPHTPVHLFVSFYLCLFALLLPSLVNALFPHYKRKQFAKDATG